MSRKRRRNSRRPGTSRSTPGTAGVTGGRTTPTPGSTLRSTPGWTTRSTAPIPGEAALGGEQAPPAGAPYPQILRTPERSVWRSVGGLALAACFFLILPTLIIQLTVLISFGVLDAVGDVPAYPVFFAQAVAFDRPSGMLGTNLALAALTGVSMFLVAFVHRVRPRWLSSVGPRLRRRYLAVTLLVALVVLGAAGAVPTVLTATGGLHPQPGFPAFLVVILLTSPLQAIGEEYLFRGYLMQALGSLVANTWFPVVASSLLFALAHQAFTPALFVDRLAFGLLAAVLVRITGGLEAGIAAHVVNNLFAFTLAGLTTGVAAARSIASISWSTAALDVGGFAAFALLAWLIARRSDLRTTVAGGAGTLTSGLGDGLPVR